MILVVLAILMVIAIAANLVSRLGDASGEIAAATARLKVAQTALEAYAAASARLPCPADPSAALGAAADGVAAPDAAAAGKCAFPTGTLPWKTLGMRRDDAIDPWGRKLSYRVYAGNNGSLTQPNGLRMVGCDTVEDSPGGATAVDGPTFVGGLCRGDLPNTDVLLRNTTPAQFLAGKGLKLTDMDAPQYDDVAYVILSHGETGFGGYIAASGAAMPGAPGGDEGKNTQDTGPFTIKAHSGYDIEASLATHFDDLLVYRRLPELIQRIGLGARDWFDMGTTTLRFSQSNVSAAVGSTVTPGSSTGQSTINFANAGEVRGLTGGSTPTAITLDTSASTEGIGVAGGGSNMLQSSNNESLQVRFVLGGRTLGLTLTNIGSYVSGGVTYYEVVQLTFYRNEVQVGNQVYGGCGFADGGVGNLSVDAATVGDIFDRVDIAPLPAYNGSTLSGTSSFLVAEVKACDSGVTCKTSLDDGTRNCLTLIP